MEILQYVTDALGDASYLVVDGEVAAVVDPQRDIRDYVADAAARGAVLRYAFETHVHNDYVSGANELAALGVKVAGPRTAGYAFDYMPLDDGDEVRLSGGLLRAVASPGHTFEHTSYLAVEASGDVIGAFTGGSVLIGAAGRTDLLGPGATEELTRHQWESARRLATLLPANAEVLPTHGSGSFCSAGSSVSERRAPLADELARNPLFLDTFPVFHDSHLATEMPVPAYYRHMAPINRAGADRFGSPPVPELVTSGALADVSTGGGYILDVRDQLDHVAAHLPGALGIPESNVFLAYTGWLTPFNTRLGLVACSAKQAESITTDLFRIGYDQVAGFVPADHHTSLEFTQRIQRVEAADVAKLLASRGRPVLDVRFGYEHLAVPLPGALERPMDHIAEWVDEVGPLKPVIVCAGGMRATMAASYFQLRGYDAAVFATGGAEDVAALLPH